MDARWRLSFFCGACFGLAVGGTAGHFLVWNRFHAEPVARDERSEPMYSTSSGIGGSDLLAQLIEPEVTDIASTPAPQGGVVLNDPDHGDEPVHAEALVEVPSASEPPAPTPAVHLPPESLAIEQAKPIAETTGPETTELAPIAPVSDAASSSKAVVDSLKADQSSGPSQLDPEVVEMLKDELEGVSEQQREVWADALQGMSPADAAGIIVMWKKFGQKGAGPDHFSAPPPLFRASHPDAAPTLLQPNSPALSLLDTAAPKPVDQPLSLSARITKHNANNSNTCGYLMLDAIVSELPFDAATETGDMQIVGYRLRLEGNRYIKTGNPSHVALPHGRFFPVKLPTGEEYYTRVGRLAQDTEHRLCIDLGDRELPISPEVKLPEGTVHPMVKEGQLQCIVKGQTDPVPVGPLQVAVFFDPTRLQPQGSCLYSATAGSGQPTLVSAELTQETLEFPAP